MSTAGYSGTPLFKKLGIKPRFRVYVHNPPENYFELVEGLPEDVIFLDSPNGSIDLIHIFSERAADMETVLLKLKDEIVKNGSIWVSWYKKSAKIPTDITEDTIRNLALTIGLVDVKVCAVDEKWSGLKLVIRRENR